jgi:subtilisin-like proprotein convertase family protein
MSLVALFCWLACPQPEWAASSSSLSTLTNSFFLDGGDFGTVLSLEQAAPSAPALDGNTIPLANFPDGVLTIGDPGQWQFYVLTNDEDFANAVFVTFDPSPLLLSVSISNGQFSASNSLTTSDVDLFVSQDPALTNLDPNALAAADNSLARGVTQMIVYSNAGPGTYYVGVRCESSQGAAYGFAAVFGEQPFAQSDAEGNQLLRGFPAPAPIPSGAPAKPGVASILALALNPGMIHRVILTNTLSDASMGDLIDSLNHNGVSVVVNNHPTNGTVVNQSFVYDDSGEGDLPGALPSDGPGALTDFGGGRSLGPWQFTVASTNQPGTDESLWVELEVQPWLTNGISATLPPGACRGDFIRVPYAATNLTVAVQIVSNTGSLSIALCSVGESSNDCQNAIISAGAIQGGLTLDQTSVPPIHAGLYELRLCNLASQTVGVTFAASLQLDPNPPPPVVCTSTGPMLIAEDALSTSTLQVTNSGRVDAVEVGVLIDHPLVSDLVLRLRGPDGECVLLSENRGGASADGMGFDLEVTNVIPINYSGGPDPVTNSFDTGVNQGDIFITYDMFALPDQMVVYYDFGLPTQTELLDTGYVSWEGQTNLQYGPGASTVVTIIMNPDINPDPETAWWYSVSYTATNTYYLTFTENTNLTFTPIKFAPTPLTNFSPVAAASGISNEICYLPEESLDAFAGHSALGQWSLDIVDSSGGGIFPPPVLAGWQLSLLIQDTLAHPSALSYNQPFTNTLAAGQIQWFTVQVPGWAAFATNALVSASVPVNLWFNQTGLPTGTNAGDIRLLTNAQSGVATIQTRGSPALIPGATYYLGVQNTNSVSASFVIQIDFDLTSLALGVPLSSTLAAGPLPRYFVYNAASNESGVSFQLLNLDGNVNLVASPGLPLPTLDTYYAGSFNPGSNGQQIVLFTNGFFYTLTPGTWYLGVFNADATNVDYTILVTDQTNAFPGMDYLSDGEPFSNTSSGDPAFPDYYAFSVPAGATRAQFEIINPSADMTLIASYGLPLPTLAKYQLVSANPGTNNELITLFDTSQPVALMPGDWFLAAVSLSGVPATYTILATTWSDSATNVILANPLISDTNSFCFTWPSEPGIHYFVQGKAHLSDPAWVTLGPITAIGSSTTWCMPLPSTYQFFRVGEGLVLNASVPPLGITTFTRDSSGLSLQWDGSASASFRVEWTPTLSPPSWTPFTNILTSATGLFAFRDDGSQTGGLGPSRFYRLRQLP